MPLRRRKLVAISAALVCTLAATSGVASGSNADSGTTLSVGVQQGYSLLPVYVALRHGFFKQAGITNISFSVFTSLPAMLTAVAQGQLDVGFQTIPAIISYNNASSSTKLKVVSASTSGSLAWGAKSDSTIPVATSTNWKSTVLAWKGKKIGIPAAGGILDAYTKYLASAAGLAPGDYSTVVVGVGPPAVAALQNGIVDLVTGDSYTMGLLKAAGVGKTVLGLLHSGPEELQQSITGVFFSSDSQIQANPTLYQGFSAGLQKARAWIADPKHAGDIQDLLVHKIGLTRDQVKALFADTVAQFSRPQSNITKATVGASLKAFFATGTMSGTPPSYDSFVAPFAH
jgi:ABC-type nitrate/sulfonate/bicarbonate transport system substrate-binding protein